MPNLNTLLPSSTLSFSGMKHLGISGGFDLQYSAKDKALTLFLCVGKDDNRVLINGTSPKSRQPEVLKAIDSLSRWSQNIKLWMTAEKNRVAVAKTPPVDYFTHVKPYFGKLCVSEIAKDDPKMTYPGNGAGRLLSGVINSRYYFIHGGKLETQTQLRGFDCTTFPMALFSAPRLPQPGYGKQLCDALSAVQCNHEQMSTTEMVKRFRENTIPVGVYVLFSAAHVLLYDSYKNVLIEFTHGGFKMTPAAQRPLQAPQNLWWLRKLPESYRAAFA